MGITDRERQSLRDLAEALDADDPSRVGKATQGVLDAAPPSIVNGEVGDAIKALGRAARRQRIREAARLEQRECLVEIASFLDLADFDRHAAMFQAETGITAPGKDIPAADGYEQRAEGLVSYEQRAEAWRAWLVARRTSLIERARKAVPS